MTQGLDEKYDVIIFIACLLSLYSFGVLFQVPLSEIAILNGLIGALGIFTFFFLQILISRGAWM